MATHQFKLGKQGELQARFCKATLDMNAAYHQARELAAQMAAERSLAKLSGKGPRHGLKP